MDEYLETFYLCLEDNGFTPDEGKKNWTGEVSVDWCDAESEEWQTAKHIIKIWLPESFPYHMPVVIPKDDPPLTPSWHVYPGNPLRGLCLWDLETGWKPEYTAQKLLKRICDWFCSYHTNTWPTNSQVPDLHIYLQKIGVVVIGENWKPVSNMEYGLFWLWRSKEFNTAPSIATCGETQCEPEPRLTENMVLGSNLTRFNGAWFRVPHPFVPSDSLETLLNQIEDVLGKPSDWAVKKCTEAAGIKSNANGFPLAIGYPDNQGEERWLFLWSHFPNRKAKRFKWSIHQNLRQIKVKSFQTAPASKTALLRRSAYISRSLTCKRVAIFGVGTLGSSIALLLAKAGVEGMRLIDSDTLMPGNAMRHVCGLNYVGFLKTEATKFLINRHNPDCYVECFNTSWDKETLQRYIDSCDLVIDATGSTNFSRHLNQICVKLHQPIIFSAAYRRARVGRIILRLEDSSPCLECYLNHRGVWSEEEYPTIPANPDESFIEDGCGSATDEAIALDVEAIANFVSRQVIKTLQGINNENNLGIVINDPLQDAQNAILHFAGTHFWSNKAFSGCLICRKDGTLLPNVRVGS